MCLMKLAPDQDPGIDVHPGTFANFSREIELNLKKEDFLLSIKSLFK